MGTRADFYCGKGKTAEWLGSIAWDGNDVPKSILSARNDEGFRRAVGRFLSKREDATKPSQGWPWPWPTSRTSDCSYWFFEEQVWEAIRTPAGKCYVPTRDAYDEAKAYEEIDFPDMKDRQNVVLGPRSGTIGIFGRKVIS